MGLEGLFHLDKPYSTLFRRLVAVLFPTEMETFPNWIYFVGFLLFT